MSWKSSPLRQEADYRSRFFLDLASAPRYRSRKMKQFLLCLFCILPVTALEIPNPRDHHYDFAHKTLVTAMAEKEFLETLQKKKTLYLKKLWRGRQDRP